MSNIIINLHDKYGSNNCYPRTIFDAVTETVSSEKTLRDVSRNVDRLNLFAQGVLYDIYSDDYSVYFVTVPTGARYVSINQIKARSFVLNQKVANSDTVIVKSGNKYYSKINGVEAISTSDGSEISVDRNNDKIVDLTRWFGVGNEPVSLESEKISEVKRLIQYKGAIEQLINYLVTHILFLDEDGQEYIKQFPSQAEFKYLSVKDAKDVLYIGMDSTRRFEKRVGEEQVTNLEWTRQDLGGGKYIFVSNSLTLSSQNDGTKYLSDSFDAYPNVATALDAYNYGDETICGINSGTTPTVYVREDRHDSVESFRNSHYGDYINYELKVPVITDVSSYVGHDFLDCIRVNDGYKINVGTSDQYTTDTNMTYITKIS